jgi:hypothetical protein
MNLIFLLLNILYLSYSIELSLNCNSIKNIIRNKTLRYMIFKEKKIIYTLQNFKRQTQIYYNKTIVSISEGIEMYNNLSTQDKIIIDTICDLFL